LGDIRTYQNILNSVDKLWALLIKVMDVHWKNPGVVRHAKIHTELNKFDTVNVRKYKFLQALT
jgi:hypothetical protein